MTEKVLKIVHGQRNPAIATTPEMVMKIHDTVMSDNGISYIAKTVRKSQYVP